MKSIKRAVLGFCMLAAGAALAAPQVGIIIDATRPGPVINKNIYGQIAGHAGGGTYGGMWVGAGSQIPNIRGWRKDMVTALKGLQVPLLRWPGGCFADDYHWRDGIGPRRQRPVRSSAGRDRTDDNAVGTHEFFDLASQLGADAYVSGNVGSGTPREAADWVEYMTASGDSTLARLRARNGHPAPFKVAFFGLGDEAWGCGGSMTPEYYADLYNQYAVFIKGRSGDSPKLIASGGDISWLDTLSVKKRIRDYRHGISFNSPARPAGAGEDQWFSTLKAASHLDALIGKNAAVLDVNDPTKKLSLVVGEWNTSYDPARGSETGMLQQKNSLRDALLAALHFHVFHAHADRVSMAQIRQMDDAPQAMIATDGKTMVLTPTYHAFRLYVPFQDARSLPVTLINNPQYVVDGASIPVVSASAARGKDGQLYLGLVNTNPMEEVDVAVDVRGSGARSVSGSLLTAATLNAHNTFTLPAAVVPVPFQASASMGKLVLRVPAKAVLVVAIAK